MSSDQTFYVTDGYLNYPLSCGNIIEIVLVIVTIELTKEYNSFYMRGKNK
ncbi:hypothetical protein GCM10007968_26700 [Sporolactobacillus putidus]|uniref:Uncharacterized protein n=1 Tax=Sporolactobacillus putidus TaxID=492735 RepID=A0A917S6I6_9BACL|nr:hypothetical protein GCM10007968_26700 [Sporolactobacillus putidus]